MNTEGEQKTQVTNVKFPDIEVFWKQTIHQIENQGLLFNDAVRHFEADSKVGCPQCGMSFDSKIIGRAVVCKSSSATFGVHPTIIRLAQGHCPTEGCSGDHLLIVWSLPSPKAKVRNIRLSKDVPLVGSNGAVQGYWVQKDSTDSRQIEIKHLFDLDSKWKQLSDAVKHGRRISNTLTNIGAGIVFDGGAFYMLGNAAAPNEILNSGSGTESLELIAIRNAIFREKIKSLSSQIELTENLAYSRYAEAKVREDAIQILGDILSELLIAHVALPDTLTNSTFGSAKSFLSIKNAPADLKTEIHSLLKKIPEVANQIN